MSSERQPQPEAETASKDDLKWPVGFIVMVSLAAVYVILRLVQMAGWAIEWLF